MSSKKKKKGGTRILKIEEGINKEKRDSTPVRPVKPKKKQNKGEE